MEINSLESVQKTEIKEGAFALIEVGVGTDDCYWALQMKDQQHREAPGCICLFGGRKSPSDKSPIENVMRELYEELAIEKVLGFFVHSLRTKIGEEDFLYNIFYMSVPKLPLKKCREGAVIRLTEEDLTSLLALEGIPLLSGPKEGTVQNIFMPTIALACRYVLAKKNYGKLRLLYKE
jgi:8-oxo-dGTP pyrophosphatase MutT (NUDIX family)